MNRWLVRFAMSFFLIGAVLIWEAYKASENHVASPRIIFYLIGAAASISLGVTGTRLKHRDDPPE